MAISNVMLFMLFKVLRGYFAAQFPIRDWSNKVLRMLKYYVRHSVMIVMHYCTSVSCHFLDPETGLQAL